MKKCINALAVSMSTMLSLSTANATEVIPWYEREVTSMSFHFSGTTPAPSENYWFGIEGWMALGWPGDSQFDYVHQSSISIVNSFYDNNSQPIAIKPKYGESFRLGSLQFKNGINSADSTTAFTEATMQIEIYGKEYYFGTVNDPGTDFQTEGTWKIGVYQQANGPDAFYLPDFPQLGSFWVAEGSTGYVDIYAKFGSIYPFEFRDPSGGTYSPNIPGGSVSVPDAGNLAGMFAFVCAALLVFSRDQRSV